MTKGPKRSIARYSASPDPQLDRDQTDQPHPMSSPGSYETCVASLAREVISRLADRARGEDEVEQGL